MDPNGWRKNGRKTVRAKKMSAEKIFRITCFGGVVVALILEMIFHFHFISFSFYFSCNLVNEFVIIKTENVVAN